MFLEAPQDLKFSLLEQCAPEQLVPQEPTQGTYPSTCHVRGPLTCTSYKRQPVLAGSVTARAAWRAECCVAHGAVGKRMERMVGGSRAAQPSWQWCDHGLLKPCMKPWGLVYWLSISAQLRVCSGASQAVPQLCSCPGCLITTVLHQLSLLCSTTLPMLGRVDFFLQTGTHKY